MRALPWRLLIALGLLVAPPTVGTANAVDACQTVWLSAHRAPDLPPRRFCVPHAYTRDNNDGRTFTDLSVTALWPSMAGAFEPRTRPVPYDREFWGGNLLILFGPTGSYPPIGHRFEARKRDDRLVLPAEGAFGLDHLAGDPDALPPGRRVRDAFFTGTGEGPVYGICDRPGQVPAPGCRFEYVRDGLLIGVRFALALLPQWREILEATAHLISDFDRQPDFQVR